MASGMSVQASSSASEPWIARRAARRASGGGSGSAKTDAPARAISSEKNAVSGDQEEVERVHAAGAKVDACSGKSGKPDHMARRCRSRRGPRRAARSRRHMTTMKVPRAPSVSSRADAQDAHDRGPVPAGHGVVLVAVEQRPGRRALPDAALPRPRPARSRRSLRRVLDAEEVARDAALGRQHHDRRSGARTAACSSSQA